MTPDEKLAAILAAVQTDPGNRGLGELFAACPADFAAACRSIADHPEPAVDVFTGFPVPTPTGFALETDGPPGAVFLAAALLPLGIPVAISAERAARSALSAGLRAAKRPAHKLTAWDPDPDPGGERSERMVSAAPLVRGPARTRTHYVALERPGPAADGRFLTAGGTDITAHVAPIEGMFGPSPFRRVRTIGIGDGGNEIGMGKLPHALVARNVPNGDSIHGTVATDFLLVAGVSNWGAYALAAGVYAVRGVVPPADQFDPDRERAVLESMVRDGGLVDGLSGRPTATVDGLGWDVLAGPLVRLREILSAGSG